eukprot:6200641-Pleurochrysis_carterae.AAC.4
MKSAKHKPTSSHSCGDVTTSERGVKSQQRPSARGPRCAQVPAANGPLRARRTGPVLVEALLSPLHRLHQVLRNMRDLRTAAQTSRASSASRGIVPKHECSETERFRLR